MCNNNDKNRNLILDMITSTNLAKQTREKEYYTIILAKTQFGMVKTNKSHKHTITQFEYATVNKSRKNAFWTKQHKQISQKHK